MNEIINKFLLTRDKFLCEMHNLDLLIVLVGHLQKTKKGNKNLKKREIHDIFIKTN